MKPPLSAASTQALPRPDAFLRVAQALAARGHAQAPLWLEVAARTSQEAADALGVALGQIAKSVVFRRQADDQAVLVIASGDRRVDEHKLAALAGPVGRADARSSSSAPASPSVACRRWRWPATPFMLIDRELLRFERIWAAAGHPNGVFSLTPAELQALTGAPLADVVQS